MPVITSSRVLDLRFPTSATMDGSDAMNPDGDYSAAYVILETDDPGLAGYGMTFTIGRGNDVCVLIAERFPARLVGLDVGGLASGGMARLYRDLVGDSQWRWLGPEKGAIQLSIAAVLNAAWDLMARHAGVPAWELLSTMSPQALVYACDFRYLSDAITPEEAVEMLEAMAPTRAGRIEELRRSGYPAYTTGPGWLGYSDDKLRRLVREAVAEGFRDVKLKVGARLEDDIRRLGIARDELGPDLGLMIDCNQVWEVDQAICWVRELARFRPRWIEEPTSPDDIAGHRRVREGLAGTGVGVATGEHAQNRVVFKQLLQSGAIDYCQIDSCRVASINEIVPILLMAAKFGVPVCPHAGGVGLCEYVQHLSIFDYVCVSGSLENRMTEYVDHLNEHYVNPAVVRGGAYQVPARPGYSIEVFPESMAAYRYPDGEYWGQAAQASPAAVAGKPAFPAPLDPGDVAGRRKQLLQAADETVEHGPFAATWDSLSGYQVPGWYTDAKFGIFIHWLASSVPAYGTDWYPRTMYLERTPEYAHHRQTYGDHDSFGFKDFLPQFTGENFDAAEWMALFSRAGARYVVPVAEHHDGYHLGHTDLSRWSATRVGPHRDVLGELKAAAAAEGLNFGLSSHRAENWWFFEGGTRFDSDVRNPQWADLYGPARLKAEQPDEAFLEDWLARTVELVERYDPELVFFDWWIEEPAFEPYRRKFAAYFYDRAAAAGHSAVINYKWQAFREGTAVYDIERGAARGISPLPFQNDSSSSRIGWAYLAENEYKQASEIIIDLVDAVSKNGVLLLNIGPRPDGTIDPAERRLLEDIGDWMSANGEAIYGTQPWLVHGEGPTMPPAGSFVDSAPAAYTPQDIRFTTRGNALYAAVLNLPQQATTVTIQSLAATLRLFDGDVAAVRLLGTDTGLTFSRGAQGLSVQLPGRPGTAAVGVLRIDLEPAGPPPRVEPPIAD